MATSDTLLARLEADLRQEFPGHRYRTKPTWFPGHTRTTTIGQTIWLPSNWEQYSSSRRYRILKHEAVHMRQFMRIGCGNATLGIVPYLIAYLLLPIPLGGAVFRYRWEREAYAATLRAYRDLDGQERAVSQVEAITARLCGRPYYWSWLRRKATAEWFLAKLKEES